MRGKQAGSSLFNYALCIAFVGQCGIHLNAVRIYWLVTILIRENIFSLMGALLKSLWDPLCVVNLVLDERVKDAPHLLPFRPS